MKRHVSITLICTLALLFVILSQPVYAQDYSYNNQVHALEFKAVSSGSITPTGTSFAWTNFVNEKSAIRYSLLVVSNITSATYEQEYNGYREYTDDRDIDSFGGTVSFSPQWVYFPMSGHRLQVSTAVGPLIAYSWDTSLNTVEHVEDDPTNNYDSYRSGDDENNRSLEAGIFVTLGNHYFFTPNFALSGWWGVEMTVDVVNYYSADNVYHQDINQYDEHERNKSSSLDARIRTSTVGLGLTFFY